MKHINIEIDDDLHKKAKLCATKNDLSLKEFFIEQIKKGVEE